LRESLDRARQVNLLIMKHILLVLCCAFNFFMI